MAASERGIIFAEELDNLGLLHCNRDGRPLGEKWLRKVALQYDTHLTAERAEADAKLSEACGLVWLLQNLLEEHANRCCASGCDNCREDRDGIAAAQAWLREREKP